MYTDPRSPSEVRPRSRYIACSRKRRKDLRIPYVHVVLTVTEWLRPCNHEAHQCGAVQIDGDITYNGEPFSNFFPQRTSAYVDQASHYPLRISAIYTANSPAYCEQT